MNTLQQSMRNIFKLFRQQNEIIDKICSCVKVDKPQAVDEKVASDRDSKQNASLNKLSTLIEFIRCMPVIVRRDKNASIGMKYVMTSAPTSNAPSETNTRRQPESIADSEQVYA